jgi:hypothetical protein
MKDEIDKIVTVLIIATLFIFCVVSNIGIKNDSYNEGYEDGYEAGYSEGYSSAENKYYDIGYDDGYTNGKYDNIDNDFENGYREGYDDGYFDACTDAGIEPESVQKIEPTSNTASNKSAVESRTQPQSQTVYITVTGTKYHRAECQYLNVSRIPIALSDAIARGYTPCSKCW